MVQMTDIQDMIRQKVEQSENGWESLAVDVEDDVAKVGEGEAEHEGGNADAKRHLQENVGWLPLNLAKYKINSSYVHIDQLC